MDGIVTHAREKFSRAAGSILRGGRVKRLQRCGDDAGAGLKHDLVAILDAHGAALHAVLYRLTLRHDAADDLLQELFVRLAGSRGFAASPRARAAT